MTSARGDKKYSAYRMPTHEEWARDYDALRTRCEALEARNEQYKRALEVLFGNTEGDLDYIKWYITEKVLTIEARSALAAREVPNA